MENALKSVSQLVEGKVEETIIEDTAINVIRKMGKEVHAVKLVIIKIRQNAKLFHTTTLNTSIIILAY